MANFVVGVIASIGTTQTITSKKSGNSLTKRDVVLMLRRFDPNTGEPLTDSENTPQFSFINDMCKELDNYVPGQVVTVYFNIQGTKYTDQSNVTKIINDIRPYRIEPYQPKYYSAPQPQAPQPQAPAQTPQYPPMGASSPQYPQSAPQPTNGYGPQPQYGGRPQSPTPSTPQNGGGYKAPF